VDYEWLMIDASYVKAHASEAWRGIATRYAKNPASFVAAVQIRCIAL
jgi:hypothetical protein